VSIPVASSTDPHLASLPYPSTIADLADWRNEPCVFAPAELGWLAEEARRRLHRQVGLADGFHVLDDVHHDVESFHLLAAHPRLMRRAAALLGGPALLESAFVHCGSLARPCLPARADVAVIVVPLGWRAEAALGGISLGTRPDRRSRYEWPLVAIYRLARDGAASPLDDDCLWPSASTVAG
jgi:hypothetical protein